MLYYFAILLVSALILIVSNPRSESNRWAAIFLVSASLGGLIDELRDARYEGWADAIQFVNLTVTPYAVVIFCMSYSDLVNQDKWKSWLKGLLLIPVAMMAVITKFEPVMAINYKLVLTWAAPYYLGGCCLLVVSLWMENNHGRWRNRLVTTLIIVPTLLAALLFIYVAKVIYPNFEFFEYVSYFLIYSFGMAVLCVFVYGVLGVRLRFERDPLDNTMKSVSTGARLLNHTLKNEIGKIAISSENLKRGISTEDELSQQHLRIITDSSDHMLAMVERIHSRMKDIVLKPELCRLDLLVEQCLAHNQLRMDKDGIAVYKDFFVRPTLLCDPVHLKEVIDNLLLNAAEAMKEGGTIRVVLSENGKGLALSIEDTGAGIADDVVAHVFEPFYSTKNNSGNFGLGLSYVYNVMRKSGGSVDISSRVNEGTRFTLHFPRKKKEKGGI
ncbi:sensor histidine kinase [Cohnella sp. WQ 127256]|uniref:sensor histidine kinase n=1 Tax=Cohnella sp. WQ 127256 TaxID=2938790 RepID=UPI0021181D1A|nr:sensor histidine kinase [Cohnella sp. WQ 127256]